MEISKDSLQDKYQIPVFCSTFIGCVAGNVEGLSAIG